MALKSQMGRVGGGGGGRTLSEGNDGGLADGCGVLGEEGGDGW